MNTEMKLKIHSAIDESINVKKRILDNPLLLDGLEKSVNAIVSTYLKKGKVLLCGNGGSAADAQHLAAELSGRFYFDRPALFAEALHVNSSFVTAVSNDFGYDAVYARMVDAAGREGDILLAFSTSGTSKGIINAIQAAREKKMFIIGFTGATGGAMKDICDILLNVPSTDTPRIQESHILLGHVICEHVERICFSSSESDL
jgi:D-sedoheptulose 7-phosphate isomerase